jgi:hypothetical protein
MLKASQKSKKPADISARSIAVSGTSRTTPAGWFTLIKSARRNLLPIVLPKMKEGPSRFRLSP